MGREKTLHGNDEHYDEALDDVDEHGYSVAFVTEKYAGLAHQTGGTVMLIHVVKKQEEDLGIKMVGNKNPKINTAFISDLSKKGPAEKTKLLKIGDQLLEINGKTLNGRTLLQVTNLVKTHQLNAKVSLVIIRRKDAHAQMASEAESKAQMEKEASLVSNFNDMLSAPTKGPTASASKTPAIIISSQAPSSSKAPDSSSNSAPSSSPNVITVMEVQKANPQQRAEEPTQPTITYPPRQKRPVLPPGTIKACVLSKVAGVDLGFAFYAKQQSDDQTKVEIFITKINPGSAAWLEGSLDNGDQILGINDKLFINVAKVDEAQSILENATGDVEIIYRKKPHLLKNKELPTNYETIIQHARQGNMPATNSPSSDNLRPNSDMRAKTSGMSLPIRSVPYLDYNARRNDIKTNEETWIMIDKGAGQASQHIGLSIVGGSQTELKYIVINGIVAESPAEKDGRLRPGDIILQIDEWDMRNSSHHEAMKKLNELKQQVYLLIRRDRHGICEERLNDIFKVDLIKRPGHGLGICIGMRQGGGVFIKRLIADSAAVNDGRIAVDDVLLEMNGVDLRDMPLLDVAFMLKMSMGIVVLTIARNRWSRVCNMANIGEKQSPTAISSSSSPQTHAFKMPRSPDSVDVDTPQHSHSHGVLAFITDQLDRARRQRIAYRRYRSRSRSISPGGTFTSNSSGGSGEILASPTHTLHSIVHWFSREHDYILENQYEVFDVQLKCNAQGEIGLRVFNGDNLDHSLIHARVSEYPFAVTSLAPYGPAKQSNVIRVGDRVISVNEQLVACMKYNEVAELLRGEPDSLVLLRFERPLDNGVVAKVPRLPVDAPPELSVKKTTVHRGSETLGLSLVGGLDEKTGRFVPFQVKSLLQNGAALKAGVKPGDCVLAVNDITLESLTHESAVYLLKRAQGQALLTILTF